MYDTYRILLHGFLKIATATAKLSREKKYIFIRHNLQFCQGNSGLMVPFITISPKLHTDNPNQILLHKWLKKHTKRRQD